MTRPSVDSLQILKLIGSTPLYKLDVETGGAEVWIKLEGGNPGGSIKDRAAWGMLKRAEEEGLLENAKTIVEPTSGNTGIGLVLLGRMLGLRVILTMPETMSEERRSVLKAYGAELVLTPASEGMAGAALAAEQILQSEENCITLGQFSNPGNAWAHEMTTGPEILKDIPKDKKLAAFVASFGTGGTISGTGRALRKEWPDVEIIAVEPAASPLLSEGRSGPHAIQGIGANFVPDNLDRSIISRFLTVTDECALETAKSLASCEGLFSGISTGANVWAAVKAAREFSAGEIVVTVQPDRGDKYMSVLFK